MLDLPLGHAGAELVALVMRYPWQSFTAVLVAVLLARSLLSNDRSRDSDFDLGLFGGEVDCGGDGGGD